jgi:preprotein translocase subunit SecF
MVQLIQRRGWWYFFSGLLAVAGAVALSLWGLRFGLDFTGGSLMAVDFKGTRPSVDAIQKSLEPLSLGTVVVQPTGSNGELIRFRDVTEETHQQILEKLKTTGGGEVAELRFESVGPIIGSELRSSSMWAIVLALFFIVSYIAWAFRKVSRPVASWKYGVVAVVALVHDLLITVGVFSFLGHFYGVEVDALFVSAILTVLGFSVHDTIVVFDRTRENLFRGAAGTFEDVVNKSVNETLVRSINTSFTTLLVLSALYLFGGDSIKHFTLALLVGIAVGTYSSIFVASPLIVDWNHWSNPQVAKARK